MDEQADVRVLAQAQDPSVPLLERWGVDLVADGEEGERWARSEAYDLIILDMRLPGKSGLEVLRGIRARGPAVRGAGGRPQSGPKLAATHGR